MLIKYNLTCSKNKSPTFYSWAFFEKYLLVEFPMLIKPVSLQKPNTFLLYCSFFCICTYRLAGANQIPVAKSVVYPADAGPEFILFYKLHMKFLHFFCCSNWFVFFLVKFFLKKIYQPKKSPKKKPLSCSHFSLDLLAFSCVPIMALSG